MLALLGCTVRSAPPATLSHTTVAADRYELVPANASGDLTVQIHAGGTLRQIGIAQAPGEPTRIVTVKGRDRMTELFTLPRNIDGFPRELAEYDVAIGPLPAIEADWARSAFSIVASASDASGTTFEATWYFEWDPALATFAAHPPQIVRRVRGKCLVCSDTAAG
jgi:hypothetical protein